MLQHQHRPGCPCHRVVRASGELGGYVSGHLLDKVSALRGEGIVCQQERVDLGRYRFDTFRGQQPLARLRELQQEITKQLSLSDPPICDRIAGVDVAYRQRQGVAAYVEVDAASRQPVYQYVLKRIVDFPYIPTYLAFRELPILLELLERVGREQALADVVMVDGSGILHPFRAGVATLLGVVARVPTIGVTKRRLYGQFAAHSLRFGRPQPVVDPQTQETIGAALLPTRTTHRPLFVSPGHQISVDRATRIVQDWLGQRRLPEPIYWADRLSRRA
jgi:deoxyribonuclease V